MKEELKQCPFCAEDIKRNALKCKHCGEFLEKEEFIEEEKTTNDQVKYGDHRDWTQQKNINKKKEKPKDYADWDGTKPSNNDGKINKGFISFLVILVVGAGYYISIGTPNPGLIFNEDSAIDNCIRLANKNKGSFLIEDSPVRANKTWIKDGMRVVQLLQNYNDDIKEIMCIVGNDVVEIPGILEQGKWR